MCLEFAVKPEYDLKVTAYIQQLYSFSLHLFMFEHINLNFNYVERVDEESKIIQRIY